MLLEVLSDFQITIPEMGPIHAKSMPIVLLTSNNSRELTEALKRRCLYLWLDYPSAERELEIVRLHTPDLDEAVAERLVEVVHMIRQLDLKKPPSIAESIDWARTLLLIGAEDIDRKVFEDSISIIVKHRSDIDLVAERVAVKLGDPAPAPPTPQADDHSRDPARLLRGASLGGGRGGHLGDPRRLRGAGRGALDRPARLPRGAGFDRREVPGGPPGLRAALRPPLLPRRRDRRARPRGDRGAPRGLRAPRPRRAARGHPPGDRRRRRRRDARPRPPGHHRLRPAGRALGRDRRRRPADPPRPRAPVARARAQSGEQEPLDPDRSASSSATCAASSSAGRSSAPASCRPPAPWPSSTARCRPAPPRTSPASTAPSAS